MRPAFHPRLINGPFDDPGLFIPFLFENRAIIFDLGDIHAVSAKDILKISHAFITHTHMDHFVGFERLLRLFLGREKNISFYGPKGFIKNIEGKLAGYSWNLVNSFQNQFVLNITEVREKYLLSNQYVCREGFSPSRRKPHKQKFNSVLLDEHGLSVSTVQLDHEIPSLGFSIKEQFHINILKDRLENLGLKIGPWIKKFKQALYKGEDLDSPFEVQSGKENIKRIQFILGDLKDKITLITPGQKITYIVDVAYTDNNAGKIVAFAKDSDHLFIEAAFLEKHMDIAKQKHHLTARQAGRLAGKSKAKQFTPFHFSPRYKGEEQLLRKEAMEAYKEAIQ
ncbi:MAG: ribonuclease Z [Deltaproteobacteria bacterium]|nr:ribonuclease Z [Deltaproteobacteria bacterium]MBW2179538.1 ribonuclease Z [Deltaproteobacteria bacterium]